MNKALFLIVAIFLLIACIIGCSKYHSHKHTTKKVQVERTNTEKIHEYQVRTSDDSWLFWYLIFSNNGNTYYYSSPTSVRDFSGVRFSSSSGGTPTNVPGIGSRSLPEEIKEAVEKSEETHELEVTEQQEPEVIDETEIAGVENPDDAADDPSTDASSDSSESMTDSSSDSSSSSSDSGSSDSGGGGDGGSGGE